MPSGELTGFSIDLGRELAKDLGVEVEFVPTSWTQVVARPDRPALRHGRHGPLDHACPRPRRELLIADLDGSDVLVAEQGAGGDDEDARRTSIEPDVRIVVYAGSSQEGVAARLFPKATLVKIEGDADPVAPWSRARRTPCWSRRRRRSWWSTRHPTSCSCPSRNRCRSTNAALGRAQGRRRLPQLPGQLGRVPARGRLAGGSADLLVPLDRVGEGHVEECSGAGGENGLRPPLRSPAIGGPPNSPGSARPV